MSSRHAKVHHKGYHRKPGKAKQYMALGGTTAATGVVALGMGTASAATIPQPTPLTPPAVTVAATTDIADAHLALAQAQLIRAHADHVLHLKHLYHLYAIKQQQWAQEHPVVAAVVVQSAAQPPGADPAVAQPVNFYHGSGSMQDCIIARESGGDSQVMNSTGHYGLYQFSSSTWAVHGGNPADFGHASVSEQNRVYYNTVAQDGYSDWAPYDGC